MDRSKNRGFKVSWRCALMLMAGVVVSSDQGLQASEAAPVVDSTRGYRCVFMGHSFFCPIAKGLTGHAKRAGFEDHSQLVVMAGGAKGTPGWFWQSKQHRNQIQQSLGTGEVDLVGMTYHPDGGVAVEDYKRWIDFALKHNPKTSFFLARPWSRQPGRDLDEYARLWTAGTPKWGSFSPAFGKGIHRPPSIPFRME
jgi:hypothetical protein